jgi:hypothetical protein
MKPRERRHLMFSLLKSFLRIAGCVGLVGIPKYYTFERFVVVGALFGIAELCGIAEEM